MNIIFSNLATLIFGSQDITTVDIELLAPPVQRYLRKNKQDYETVELQKQTIVVESSD